MTDANHHIDFAALTEQQRHVLGMIAVSSDGGHHQKTIESLLKKGLICQHDETLHGLFPVHIKRYSVPMHVHIRWCQWCSEHYDDEGNEI